MRKNIQVRKDERSITVMRGNAWERGKTKEPKSIAVTGKTITENPRALQPSSLLFSSTIDGSYSLCKISSQIKA